MFVIDEGSLEIPPDWKDETINVLSPRGDGPPSFTLVVNRDALPWGMTFADYVKQEVGKIGETLTDYKQINDKEYTLSGHPAHVLEYQWQSQQGPLHQFVVMTALENKVLIFTASAPKKMTDNQKRQFQEILGSFKTNSMDDNGA